MVTVAEYKAWASRARAWYETNSRAVPKKNSALLVFIPCKPAQVVAVCVPIELTPGPDGVQRIGEVLDAYFGVDGCEGLLSAVRGLIHGRRGHKPMLEYSMGVAEVLGRIQLQDVVIEQRLSGCALLENSDLSVDQRLWRWLPQIVMCRFLLFKLLCGICLLTHNVRGLSVWSQIHVIGLALPLNKAKIPIRRVDTKVVADVAGEVMAELPDFVAARPVTSLLTVGHRLGTKLARGGPLLLMLRKCRRKERIHWSLKTGRRNMRVLMLVCATWPTLVWMWVLIVCDVCSQSVS